MSEGETQFTGQESKQQKKWTALTAVITDERGRFLLIKRARGAWKGQWTFISGIGASKGGMSPAHGVRKEVSGDIDVQIEKPVFLTRFPISDDDRVKENIAYLCRMRKQQIPKPNPRFVQETQWVEPDNPILNQLPNEHGRILEELRKKTAYK